MMLASLMLWRLLLLLTTPRFILEFLIRLGEGFGDVWPELTSRVLFAFWLLNSL